jgi:hypothetical protein
MIIPYRETPLVRGTLSRVLSFEKERRAREKPGEARRLTKSRARKRV